MGSVRAVYLEDLREFRKVIGKVQLDLKETRKHLGSKLRYCLQGDVLTIPADIEAVENHRACWARISYDVACDLPFEFEFATEVPSEFSIHDLDEFGIGFGSRYCARHKEDNGKRIAVSQLCSQELIDKIAENPEALAGIGKDEFESLCGELFARRGFEVDLFRKCKDDGIDFLAVRSEDADPIIMSVQCKHTDSAKKTLPVTTVREIYGVAKANDYHKCLAITSTKYSSDAKRFMELKPDEISLANHTDVLEWVTSYRWNDDER